VDPAIGGIQGAPRLKRLVNRLLEPEARIQPLIDVFGIANARQPGGEPAVRPKQFGRFNDRGGGIGGKRPDPGDQATRFQQVEITMSCGMA
jgi:hypothetical protein